MAPKTVTKITKRDEPAMTAIDKARAELQAATTEAATLREQLGAEIATEAECKRIAGETDTSEAWDALDASMKRLTRLRVKSERADAEVARLQAVVAQEERTILEAKFEELREQSGDRALRAAIEEAVRLNIEIAERVARRDQVVARATVGQNQAVDEAQQIGRQLGMTDREVQDQLSRDRGPIGYASNDHDRSVRRPWEAVIRWMALLSDVRGSKPPALDEMQQRALHTGAPRASRAAAAE